MNTERYYDIITKAAENYGLTRREATLIVTGFCVIARNPENMHIGDYAKIIGILMGLHAAERLNDYQYEKLHNVAEQLNVYIRDSVSGYELIENIFAHDAMDD